MKNLQDKIAQHLDPAQNHEAGLIPEATKALLLKLSEELERTTDMLADAYGAHVEGSELFQQRVDAAVAEQCAGEPLAWEKVKPMFEEVDCETYRSGQYMIGNGYGQKCVTGFPDFVGQKFPNLASAACAAQLHALKLQSAPALVAQTHAAAIEAAAETVRSSVKHPQDDGLEAQFIADEFARRIRSLHTPQSLEALERARMEVRGDIIAEAHAAAIEAAAQFIESKAPFTKAQIDNTPVMVQLDNIHGVMRCQNAWDDAVGIRALHTDESRALMERPEAPELETKWPSIGPDFNSWHIDLKGFMQILFDAEKEAFWCCDFDIKYLNLRIDTRDNAWLLYADGKGDGAPKVRIDPERVVAAVEKWNNQFDKKPSKEKAPETGVEDCDAGGKSN